MYTKTGSKGSKRSKSSKVSIQVNTIQEQTAEYIGMSHAEVPTLISIIQNSKPKKKIILNSPEKVHALMSFLEKEDREKFYVLHLTAQNELILKELLSIGDVTGADIPYRNLFKAAIISNAYAIICVHNHPSGNPMPSKEDREVTERIQEISKLLDIRLRDHVIIGEGKFSHMLPTASDYIKNYNSMRCQK